MRLDFVGYLPRVNNQGAGQVPVQFRGDLMARITVFDYPSAGRTRHLVFLPEREATAAEMNAFGNGRIDVQQVNSQPPPLPVCFAAGTRLLTPAGEVPVEDIRPGDLLVTLDEGPQPVLWASRSSHSWPAMPEAAKPVVIPAGALAQGCPARDLIVSPQHRILVGQPEILVPALALIGRGGIRRMHGKRTVDYHHVLLPRHSIVLADQAPAESLYPGRVALRQLGPKRAAQIRRLFPALRRDPDTGYGPHARPVLRPAEARRVLAGPPRSDRSREPMRPPAPALAE
ncbi:MAG: Hint domain-containing protein [Gemmobacter sp.]